MEVGEAVQEEGEASWRYARVYSLCTCTVGYVGVLYKRVRVVCLLFILAPKEGHQRQNPGLYRKS